MKTSNKVMRYIDGQMNDCEKETFEYEMKKSGDLAEEVKLYKKYIEEIKTFKNIPVEEEYFLELLPKFRQRLSSEKTKRFSHPYTIGAAAVVVVIFIFFLIINQLKNKTTDVASDQIKTELRSEKLDNNYEQSLLSSNYTSLTPEETVRYDSLLNNLLIKELNVLPANINKLTSLTDNDENNLIPVDINQNEANEIYAALKNKRFF